FAGGADQGRPLGGWGGGVYPRGVHGELEVVRGHRLHRRGAALPPGRPRCVPAPAPVTRQRAGTAPPARRPTAVAHTPTGVASRRGAVSSSTLVPRMRGLSATHATPMTTQMPTIPRAL